MNRSSLYLMAARAAEKVRIQLSLNMFESINIFDTCNFFNIEVRFVPIDMEGLYISSDTINTILLSNQRPLVRQNFTCAHEFGHFYFKHGSKIDELSSVNSYSHAQDNEEKLVDAFAGYLLMPIAGIELYFHKRKLEPNNCDHKDFYILSSYYGVGFHTIVYHCRANNMISPFKANLLLKYSPQKILTEILDPKHPKSKFKLFPKDIMLKTIDIEVSSYIFLPEDCIIESNNLERIDKSDTATVYKVLRCGIIEGYQKFRKNKFLVRAQNIEYIGLAEFRHLETNN